MINLKKQTIIIYIIKIQWIKEIYFEIERLKKKKTVQMYIHTYKIKLK